MAHWLTTLFANLIVLYFAFSAFNRPGLALGYVGCAAVIFASLGLLDMLVHLIPRDATNSLDGTLVLSR